MAEVVYGIKFEVIRSPTGGYVTITAPNGTIVELHDFQSEAGAKIWIKVNARKWAKDHYIERSNLKMKIKS